MNRRKLGLAFWIAGGTLLGVGLIMVIANFAIKSNSEDGEGSMALLVAGIVLTVVGLIVAVVGYIFGFKADAKLKAQWQASYMLPYQKISDFKGELETVRKNYAADTEQKKNVVPKRNYFNSEPLFDTAALSKGKIYYGYALNIVGALTDNKNLASYVLPMEVIYSPDEFFERNPLELKVIAKIYNESRFKRTPLNEKDWAMSVRLPKEVAGEREVYLTTIMAYRPHLPVYYVSDKLFPIIASPACTAAFVVDCKYWTDNFIGNYCHGEFQKAHNETFGL